MIIAGAGCGDPELITVKAARYLQQADTVLTDRLVSDEILNSYVSAGAEIIYVGKQCRRGYSTPQQSINELLVQNALEGKLIVRLKGGDVSVFSNILDELEALTKYNIPYEIIPGITAATGASAFAGIPLTARGYATAVRFLTAYASDIVSDHYWKELAQTNDTLVFYMSSETLDHVVERLTAENADDKLLAVIEQATTPFQNVIVSSLKKHHEELRGKIFVSPSLVIIGKVVALHKRFAWLPNSSDKEIYFKPVESLTNIISKPEKILHVSRA